MNKTITSQNRTGKIASGVSFTVTIDVDTSTYNLTINYYLKGTKQSVMDSKTENHKNGESGSITCPGKTGFITETDTVNYSINGKDSSVICYYTRETQQTPTE